MSCQPCRKPCRVKPIGNGTVCPVASADDTCRIPASTTRPTLPRPTFSSQPAVLPLPVAPNPHRSTWAPDTRVEVTYMLVNADDDTEYTGTMFLNVFDESLLNDETWGGSAVHAFKHSFTLRRSDDPKIVIFNLPNVMANMTQPVYFIEIDEQPDAQIRMFRDTVGPYEVIKPIGGIVPRTIYIEPKPLDTEVYYNSM